MNRVVDMHMLRQSRLSHPVDTPISAAKSNVAIVNMDHLTLGIPGGVARMPHPIAWRELKGRAAGVN